VSVGRNGSATQPTFWHAPELAKAGYPVFPVNGKEPTVEGGFYACSTDMSQIAEWIEDGHGDHDVAIPTGLPSGIVVIDADTAEVYAKMEERYGRPTVLTRRGGHWWFAHPRNGKVWSNNVEAGLDRKGDGGFVAVPPSRARTWTNGIPDRSALPVLPREFWNKRSNEKTDAPRQEPQDLKEAAAEAIASRVVRIPQGKRHEHLRHLCGVLLARDVTVGDAQDVLIAAWTKAGGELAERARREVANTLATTEQAIAEGRATGVPSLEQITPGLCTELEGIFGWTSRVTVGSHKTGEYDQPEAESTNSREDRRNQADRLIGYALEDVQELFVDQHGAPHALIDGEPVPLTSRCYSWLRRLMWEEEGRSVSGEYLKMAAGTLSAHAEFSGEVRELYTRAAWHEGVLYYELRPGKVVRVGPGGWTFEAKPPVLFRHYVNLKALPDPEAGGSLDVLDGLVNLKSERDRRLFKAYLVTLPLEHAGRPIFNASGAMGSGKTTIQRLIKRLLDPTAPETVRFDPRDFLQKAMHAYIVMLDNQNTIPEWASDTLCRLVTGEADSKRRLYTDDEDFIIELRRAALLNGINVPTDRGDVLDRSLVVELERIPDGDRKTEEQIWELFAREHPHLLGVLFDTLSKAIALKPSVKLSRRPRLADWGEYAAAVYEVMGWGAETFLKDWDEVVRVQNQATLDGSPVAQAIIKLMEEHEECSETSSKMHALLKEIAEAQGVDVARDKAWPKSARWLWRRIKEVLPLLVAAGIEASRGRDESAKQITLRKMPTNDGNDGSAGESRTDKGETHADTAEDDGRSNGNDRANGRSDGSEKSPSNAASANTANRSETSWENDPMRHYGRRVPTV